MYWQAAYIALGSNLEQPERQVMQAFDELDKLPQSRLIARSSLYRSVPMGPQDQPHFINAVAGVITQWDADELMYALQALEQRMGRVRAVAWGPRIIDLDLLMFITGQGELRSESAQLTLPHTGITQRNFVAVPLAEIAPLLKVAGQSAAQLARTLGMTGLVRLP